MGTEVDGMNAQVGKYLNVGRNEQLTQMSVQDIVASRHFGKC